MAIADATESLNFTNPTVLQINNRIGIIKENVEEELIPILRSIDKHFEKLTKALAFNALENTDEKDKTNDDGPKTPEVEDTPSFFDKLKDFFTQLGKALIRFVGIILPAIIAALGLSNIGFTGKEFAMLKTIRAFFSGGWWAEKLSKLATMFRENKTVIAIKEFFSSGRIGTIIDDAMKSVKAFFSMEGDGLIAKVFRGLKSFGGKIMAVFGKIMYPISLLMSAFDGFMTASADFEKNESIVSAGINFITGFLASFIGTFVDLIKDGIMWLIGKLPFVEVDEEGAFTNSILKFIDEKVNVTETFLKMGQIFSDIWSSFTTALGEWWSNFSLWDFVTGGNTAEDLKGMVTNGVTYGKREGQQEELAEVAAEKSDASGGGIVQVNAPTNTTNTTDASTSNVHAVAASGSNPKGPRKRQRGGGA